MCVVFVVCMYLREREKERSLLALECVNESIFTFFDISPVLGLTLVYLCKRGMPCTACSYRMRMMIESSQSIIIIVVSSTDVC